MIIVLLLFVLWWILVEIYVDTVYYRYVQKAQKIEQELEIIQEMLEVEKEND